MSRRVFSSSVVGSSGPLVFFLHGWPDSASDIFAKQVAELCKTHRCVLVESPWNEFTKERVLGPSFLVGRGVFCVVLFLKYFLGPVRWI